MLGFKQNPASEEATRNLIRNGGVVCSHNPWKELIGRDVFDMGMAKRKAVERDDFWVDRGRDVDYSRCVVHESRKKNL